MNKIISFIGLVFVLIGTNLYIYNRGRVDGKDTYRHSRNFQMTLDAAYNYGVFDGKVIGFISGYNKGGADCKAEFLKLPRNQKRKWCR